ALAPEEARAAGSRAPAHLGFRLAKGLAADDAVAGGRADAGNADGARNAERRLLGAERVDEAIATEAEPTAVTNVLAGLEGVPVTSIHGRVFPVAIVHTPWLHRRVLRKTEAPEVAIGP